MSEEKTNKNHVLTIILAIVITVAIGAVAGAVYYNHQLQQQNAQVTQNQTNVNTTGINGNVTSITELENGTLLLSITSEPSEHKEMKYQNNVIQSILNDAKKFSNVCTVQITTKDDNESRVVYEKPNSEACKFKQTEPEIPPVNETQPPVVNETVPPVVTNETIPPAPAPTDQTKTMKVVMVGDIESGSSGTAVFNQIKKQNATNIIILGDLGYDSNLNWFKSTYGTLGNKINCVIGNHDAAEDGSSSIEKEAAQYCSEYYYIKKNHVLFLAFNTNGDLTKQAAAGSVLLSNKDFMNGITSVHIMSHKPCAVPPNAHHPVEAKVKTFCDIIKSKIPGGVKPYYDQAHNHVLSSSTDGTYKTTGAGGKSHYTCGTSPDFNFCDNSHYGFLVYTIKSDGITTSQFIDSRGEILK